MDKVVNLDRVWNIVYIEDGCSKVQMTEDSDEAKDIIRDLIAKGTPVDDIRVYKPGSATPDIEWLKYSRLEYEVIITIPGPGPIFHPHELAKLVADYVPDCAEVVVNEGNFYTLSSMEEEPVMVSTYNSKADVIHHMLEIVKKKTAAKGYSIHPQLQYALANCGNISMEYAVEAIYQVFTNEEVGGR